MTHHNQTKELPTWFLSMVKSHDELVTEIAKEIGLDRVGEDAEAEDDDYDDGGDTAATPVAATPPPAPAPLAAAIPEDIIMEENPVEMVPEQEAPVARGVILANAELELSRTHLYRMLIRDFEEDG
jgi:hypothetical protein